MLYHIDDLPECCKNANCVSRFSFPSPPNNSQLSIKSATFLSLFLERLKLSSVFPYIDSKSNSLDKVMKKAFEKNPNLLNYFLYYNQNQELYKDSSIVCAEALNIGSELNLSELELEILGLAAFFHNIGKFSIPKKILYKSSKLYPFEEKIIKQYPSCGYNILSKTKLEDHFNLIPRIVGEHRLPEYGIDFGFLQHPFSSIISIAVDINGMSKERNYQQKTYSPKEILSILFEEKGNLELLPILKKLDEVMVAN